MAEVIGVTMGDPQELGCLDVRVLLGRDLVGGDPAAEIGSALDPGIGGQDGPIVVDDETGIPDGFEPELHGHSLPTANTEPEQLSPTFTLHFDRQSTAPNRGKLQSSPFVRTMPDRETTIIRSLLCIADESRLGLDSDSGRGARKGSVSREGPSRASPRPE